VLWSGLAICRFAVLGPVRRTKYVSRMADELTATWQARCDKWGIAFTVNLAVTGVFLLYFLD